MSLEVRIVTSLLFTTTLGLSLFTGKLDYFSFGWLCWIIYYRFSLFPL